MSDHDREFLLSIFLMEAWDTLATLEDGLGRLRGPEVSTVVVEPLLVVSHRLKGAAALNGFPELAGVTETLEQILERAPALPIGARGAAADFLADLLALLKKMLDGIGATGQEDAEAVAAFRAGHAGFLLTPAPAPARAGSSHGTSGGPRGEVERFFAENPDVLVYFRPEASEHLETMTQALLALEKGGRNDEQLGSLFRAVHTLKGAAYTIGCTVVGDLVHRIEDLMVAIREDRMPLTPSVIETVLVGTDALRLLLGLAEAPAAEVDALVEAAVTQVGRLMPASDAGAGVAPAIAVEASAGEAPPVEAPAPVEARIPAEATVSPRRAAIVGPAIRVSLDRLDSLMNLVGELVIARSRLDRRLSELDRAGELLLFSQERMAKAVRDFEVKREAGGWTPQPVTGRDGTGPSPAGATAEGRPDAQPRTPLTQIFEELEFDRYDDFDILARSVAELSADLTEVQTQVGGLIRTIWEDTAQIQRLTGHLKTEVTRARMVPVARLFARFGRQVREAARAAGKTVELEVSGETVEMDSSITEAIADPLLHLVQNAITHGIEPEDERQARGKPGPGTIRLRAAHRGGFVNIEVEDDGRGIDVELVKAAAVRQGFLSSEAVAGLSSHEALDLIFLPGFSTAPVVTTASGRGVGMDVVRTNVSRLGGEIAVETEPGVGTCFTLRLPLTVLISDALMIRTGTETLAIPVSAVRMILNVRPRAIQSGDGTERVRVDDRMVDLLRLDRLLGLAPGATRERIPVVVLRSGGTSLAVAVDELGGKEEVVDQEPRDVPPGGHPLHGRDHLRGRPRDPPARSSPSGRAGRGPLPGAGGREPPAGGRARARPAGSGGRGRSSRPPGGRLDQRAPVRRPHAGAGRLPRHHGQRRGRGAPAPERRVGPRRDHGPRDAPGQRLRADRGSPAPAGHPGRARRRAHDARRREAPEPCPPAGRQALRLQASGRARLRPADRIAHGARSSRGGAGGSGAVSGRCGGDRGEFATTLAFQGM